MEITETVVVIVVTLLGAGVVFLFLLLLAVVRAGSCLQRLEQMLAERDTASAAAGTVELAPRTANDGAFREFLSEDAARRTLPKREQFEAYRQWRKEKGLNWSAP
jgi:Na+-transporting methylmalonyl-CoA/oxaloacetate decarboxylase gamma subunit